MGCCGIRVSGQAIANTLCFGATAAILTYTLVQVAVKAHSKVVIAAVAVFLIIWFCAACTAYLAFCRTLYRLPSSSTEPGSSRRSDTLLSAIRRCIHGGGGDEAAPLPIFTAQMQGGGIGIGMDVLAREPPDEAVRGGARVAAGDVVTYYEQPEGVAPEECSVCKEEVRQGQMVGRPPACLHMFHRHCIDSWLQDHSTCPVCRRNVHAPLPAGAYGVSVTVSV